MGVYVRPTIPGTADRQYSCCVFMLSVQIVQKSKVFPIDSEIVTNMENMPNAYKVESSRADEEKRKA